MKKILLVFVCLPVLTLLVSCGDSNKEKIDAYVEIIERQIDRLNSELNAGTIQNAVMLRTYANKLKQIKPDMAAIAESFEQDAVADGPAIRRFKSQLDEIKDTIQSRTSADVMEDLAALTNATDIEIYGDSLIDPINVIAEMSDGALPKRSTPPPSKDEDLRPGSNLVGNPRYGRWERRGGQSVWVWLAAYSMFGRHYPPYYYHSWYYHRPWSYYHDYGRSIYSTRADRTRSQNVQRTNNRQLKEYGRKTGKRYSSYSSKRTNSRFKPSRSSQRAASSSRSRSSGYSSSHRSSSRRSRGGYGGK